MERRRVEQLEEQRPASVTAYHLTNSGQSNALDARNPPIEIYHLPLELTLFLMLIQSPNYKDAWRAIAQRAWQLDPLKKDKKRVETTAGKERPKKNFLYEDLFQLPGNASFFIRHYFLRIPVRGKTAPGDPRSSYQLRDEASLVSWKLADLFMKEVMNMDEKRINEIRELGDRLAEYISTENDRRFFEAFYAQNNYEYFRNVLIRANLACVRAGGAPLIVLDPYLVVFEEGVEVQRPDWRLARDLVLIRVIEQLHKTGWLDKNKDAIVDRGENSQAA